MTHSHKRQTSSGNRSKNKKRLSITLALVLGYMVAEVIGGLITGSLALLADAGHMASDAASLGLALFALWLASQPAGTEHTWGYYRTEILVALANGATLVAIAIYIFLEAYERFQDPPEIQAGLMMGIAAGGLVVNFIGLWVLQGGRGESLNIEGAWLHVLADTLGSVQALAAGLLIWTLGWNWADPVASVLIGLLVIVSSWRLLKESVMVLMESSPAHIDVDEVRNLMAGTENVKEVHDLHIWTITSGLVSLSAHVVCETECDRDLLLSRLRRRLDEHFQIEHITIQLESGEYGETRPSV